MISSQWAHEIVQEFVYHFQDFCQFRAQVSQRTEEEINANFHSGCHMALIESILAGVDW